MIRSPHPSAVAGKEQTGTPVAFWELAAGFLLGLAEATFFFLLPETLVTFIAMQKRRLLAALAVALVAAAGGLLGGLLLYSWAADAFPRTVTGFLQAMPGVSGEMIRHAYNGLILKGAAALFAAPLLDPPYRVFAALAGQAGMPLVTFLAVSAAVLLLRLVASALIAHALAILWRRLFARLSPVWLWGAVWLGVYGLWFATLST